MGEPGRPITPDETFAGWLDEMAPYLKQGHSLDYAMDKCGFLVETKKENDVSHERAIRLKYNRNDWFRRKVDNFIAQAGELINNLFFNELMLAVEAQKQGRALTEEQWKNLRFMAEKHRSAQRYFVTRTENASGKTVDDVLGELNNDPEPEHTEFAESIKKQDVANDPPVQNQGQAGQDNNIQPQPNTT